ncbi:DUF1016 family protein [Salmonella enterica subsp. enterica]|nr:DUF1016 family protein [Salmonella enterica subsp. enterica]
MLVDLKVGKFGYADAGQMNMYLNYAKEVPMPEKTRQSASVCAQERRGGSACAGWPAKHHTASEYSAQPFDENYLRRTYSFANHAGNSTHTRWFTDNGEN